VANVGPLLQPTTLAQYNANSVPLPSNLFSHSDQQGAWQSGVPEGPARNGWGGRLLERAVADGAVEVDMVVDVAALKDGDRARVLADIRAVRKAASKPIVLKVILECCLLSDDQKTLGARLAQEAGADFVKTSTGFSTGGATVADIALLRRTVGAGMGVKASGGIRDYATALAMVQAGANRIGASKSVQIVAGAPG